MKAIEDTSEELFVLSVDSLSGSFWWIECVLPKDECMDRIRNLEGEAFTSFDDLGFEATAEGCLRGIGCHGRYFIVRAAHGRSRMEKPLPYNWHYSCS